MNRSPQVSVILPAFNGMPYLPQAVQSIRAQTFTDWELVIVDDGSTDGSPEYTQQIASADRRIRPIRHASNRGIAAAYNTGLRAAQAPLVAFQEQDDISLPERLNRQLHLMQAQAVPFLSGKVGWLDRNGLVYRHWPDDITDPFDLSRPSEAAYYDLLIHQTRIANTTTMLSREILASGALEFDESFKRSGQDWDWHLRLARQHASLRVNEVFVHMRRHREHSSSTSRKALVFRDNRRLLRKHTLLALSAYPKPRHLSLLARAWSNELLLEARYWRRLRGALLGGLSLLLWPTSPKAWNSLNNVLNGLSPRGGQS